MLPKRKEEGFSLRKESTMAELLFPLFALTDSHAFPTRHAFVCSKPLSIWWTTVWTVWKSFLGILVQMRSRYWELSRNDVTSLREGGVKKCVSGLGGVSLIR